MPRRDQAWLNAYEAKQRGKQFKNCLRIGEPEELEGPLHDQIINACERMEWPYVHSRMDKPSRVGVGTFDFIIGAKMGITLLVECKARDEEPNADQEKVHAAWRAAGFKTCVCWNLEEFWAYATRMGVGKV